MGHFRSSVRYVKPDSFYATPIEYVNRRTAGGPCAPIGFSQIA